MDVVPMHLALFRKSVVTLAAALALHASGALAQQKRPAKEATPAPCLAAHLAEPGEIAEWKGLCQDDRPVGRGKLLWLKDGVQNRVFDGEMAGGRPYGKGTIEWADGRRYEGGFQEGLFSGSGVLTQASGERYEGPFASGLPEGQGVIHRPNGERIEARFRAGVVEGDAKVHFGGDRQGDRFEGPLQDQKPHGAGIYHTAAGNRYAVSYLAGKIETVGEFTFASGDRYTGPIEKNLPQGIGLLTKASGEKVSGRFEAGVVNGRATIHYPDGRRFEGEVRAARAAGPGALFLPSGARWVGEFVDGRPGPDVRHWYPGGFVYVGAFDTQGPAGKGVLRLPDGEKIEAEFAASITPKGNAKIAFMNGDRYEGALENNLPHGQGVLETRQGNRYEGGFKEGRPEGKAEAKYASGLRYQGSFVAGIREGQGTLTWKDNSRYDGQFANGLPHGNGSLVFANGIKYTGAFANGLPSGNGQIEWGNGRAYRGGFDAGLPSGQGVMTMPNKSRFEGRFADGKRHAQGTMFMPNGDKVVLAFSGDMPEKDSGPFFGLFKSKYEELTGLLDAGYYLWAQRYYLAKRADFNEKMTQTEPLLKRLKDGLAEPVIWQERLFQLQAETTLAESGRFASAADLARAQSALTAFERRIAERKNIPLLADTPSTAIAHAERLRAEQVAGTNSRLISLLGQGALEDAVALIDEAKRESIALAYAPAAQSMNLWLAANVWRAAELAEALGQLVERGLAIDPARIVPEQQKIFDDLLLQGEFAAARQMVEAGNALKIDLLDRERAKAMARWISSRSIETGDEKILLDGITLLGKRLGGAEDFRPAFEHWLIEATATGKADELAVALAAFEKQGLALLPTIQPRIVAALQRRLDASDPKTFLMLASIFAQAKFDVLPAFKERLQFVRAGGLAKTPFPLSLKNDGPLRLNPLDETTPTPTTASTHIVLLDLHGQHLRRAFTKVDKLTSSISEGYTEHPNPEYARLEQQAATLETQAAQEGGASGLAGLSPSTGNRRADNIFGVIGMIASVSDAAGERKAAELRARAQAIRSQLAGTPRMLKKAKGMDYRYASVAVGADRVLPATVFVIDLQRASFVTRDLQLTETETMETVLGVHPKDTQIKPGERLDRIRQLERKAMLIGLMDIFSKGQWTDSKSADQKSPTQPAAALPLARLAETFASRRERRTIDVDKTVETAHVAFEKQIQEMLSIFHEEGRQRAEPLIDVLRTAPEPVPETTNSETRWVEQLARRLQEPAPAPKNN